MFVNEWDNLQFDKICKKHPNYRERIVEFVQIAERMNKDLERVFSVEKTGAEGLVYEFIIRCIANHQSLLVGFLNSLLFQSKYLVVGFSLTKFNFEYVAVINKVVLELLENKSLEEIRKKHLGNMKSLAKFLEDLPDDDERKPLIKEFKNISEHKNIIEYIKDEKINSDYPKFYENYSIINSLSHPNNFTTIQEKFPFITSSKFEYLVSANEYLQEILKDNLRNLAKKEDQNKKV